MKWMLRIGADTDGGAMTDAGRSNDSALAFARCFRQPEAYDLAIRFDAQRAIFDVQILPVPEVCLGEQAGALRGGGAAYEIDAHPYAIQAKRRLE
jgi:hypothetical protein